MTKIKGWLKRYLPAEIVGTVVAVGAGLVAHSVIDNNVVTAFVGTWGENIGFYSTIIFRDITNSIRTHRNSKINYQFSVLAKDIRNIIVEFGPAEILDSLFIRPFMMFFFTRLLNSVSLGILAGKITAYVTFYIPTVISFELRKKYLY